MKNKKQKIVIICWRSHFYDGGIEKYNATLIKILKELGHNVEEYYTCLPGTSSIVSNQLVKSKVIPNFNYIEPRGRISKIIWHIRNKWILKKHILSLIKTCHGNIRFIFSTDYAWKNKKISNLSIFIQHFDVKKHYRRFGRRVIMGNPFSSFRRLVFYTPRDLSLLRLKNKISYCIPLFGFDQEDNYSSILQSPKEASEICFIGNINREQKNFKLLERASAMNNMTIHAYGPGGEDYTNNNNVVLHGPLRRDKLMETLSRRASIIVLSSLFEGFGFVLVEGLSLGIPFLSTDSCASMAFLSNNSKCGIITSDYSVSGFAKALSNAVSRKFEKDDIISFYNQNLSFSSFKNKWLNIFNDWL